MNFFQTCVQVFQTVSLSFLLKAQRFLPVGGVAGEEEDEVVVDERLGVLGEALLLAVSADRARARDRLAEVRVDGRPGRRLNALKLPGCGDVKPLQCTRQKEMSATESRKSQRFKREEKFPGVCTK